MSAAVGLATDGVHGSWDVIVAVAVGVYLLSLVAILVLAYRSRARGDREATRQDWLLTVFVIALTVLLLIPDDTSDRAIWAWTTQAVVVVTVLLLVAREVRRRRGAR
jgi:O-antigen/teichoic acid export membrane protein